MSYFESINKARLASGPNNNLYIREKISSRLYDTNIIYSKNG